MQARLNNNIYYLSLILKDIYTNVYSCIHFSLFLRDIDADVAERLKVSEQLREGTDQNKEECYELLMELSKMVS